MIKDPNIIIDRAWQDWIDLLPKAALMQQSSASDWYQLANDLPWVPMPEGTPPTNDYLNAWENCAYHVWYAVERFASKPDHRLTPLSLGRLCAMSQWINSARRNDPKVKAPV